MIMTSLQPIMNHCILGVSLAQDKKYVGMTGSSDTGTIVAFHLEHFFSTSKKTPIPQVQSILLAEIIYAVPEIKEIDQVKLPASVILPPFIMKTIIDNISKTFKEIFWSAILAINGQFNDCMFDVDNTASIYREYIVWFLYEWAFDLRKSLALAMMVRMETDMVK